MAGWSLTERILLLVVVLLAALVVYRLVDGEAPRPEPAVRSVPLPASAPQPAALDAARPAQLPTSPAADELLARIRSCSPQDLEGIVDNIKPLEALGLFRRLDATDRQVVFAALPRPILARKAQELLGIPEACFRDSDTPGLLASSLVDTAMGGGDAPAGPHQRQLRFATGVDERGAPLDARDRFGPGDRRIYACLDGGPERHEDLSGVLVRWTERDTGALVCFRYLPFSINSRWNHVFFDVADAWPAGAYQVRFYQLGASVAPLAEGSYVIEQER